MREFIRATATGLAWGRPIAWVLHLLVAALIVATLPASAAEGAYKARIQHDFEQRLMALPSDTELGAFVHFNQGSIAQHRELLGGLGISVVRDYTRYTNAVYATGPAGRFVQLLGHPQVKYLEENKRLRLLGDTAVWATRARVAQEAVAGGPYFDAAGQRLTGAGVGIAIVDSGLNATHPDFAGRVAHNYKVLGSVVTDFGANLTTDTTGGHGTHVAGIAAGGGEASTGPYPDPAAAPLVQGTFTGVAPGASLTAYGTGELILVLYPVEAYQHILDNYDSFDPPIRVINNSWGDAGGSPHDPDSVFSALVKALVDKGVVSVFAAGNDGGDGSTDLTSGYCKDPTPGVICVANYDDAGRGTRGGSLASSSSRGKQGEPMNYPDIAAPGTNYTAACNQAMVLLGQWVCTSAEQQWLPYYGTITGTSMASPHVTGAIALLLQAHPELTPAQVESLLQRTAYKVDTNGDYEADSQNPEATTNFGFGAGLLDVPAALDALQVAHGATPPAGTEIALIGGDEDSLAPGAADVLAMSVTETTEFDQTGLRYRLTLRDATDFGVLGDNFAYVVEQVMDGRPQRFAVVAGATGVSGVTGASGTPVAVALEGNVLSFFLPYTALGFPETGSPVFKPRVAVFRLPGGNALSPLLDALTLLLDALLEPLLGLDLELLDLAPDAGASPDTLKARKPMYGRPFTVTLDAGSAPSDRALQCREPGVTRLSDASGDATEDLFASDLIALNIVQPKLESGQPALLHFVLSTTSGPPAVLPPNRAWYVSFLDKANNYHGVRAVTDTLGQLSFQSYTPAPNSGGSVDGRFVESGSEQPLESSSEFGADGKLRLVVKASAIGLDGVGDTISGFNAGVVQNIDLLVLGLGTMADEMPDGLGRSGSLTLQPNGCGTPPVARLSLSKLRGVRPLEVRFDASFSSAEEGATISEYRFDFGDGESATGSEPVVTHTYLAAGSYTASVTVTDSFGLDSEPATAVVTATDPLTVSLSAQCGAVACTADTVYEVSESAPLTVSFTATAAGGSGEQRQYTFYFGDGTQSPAQAGTTVTHDYKYANADGYHARVVVTEDAASSGATSADVVIRTQSTVTVEPQPDSTSAALELSPDSGAVPLTVTADASGSAHATGTASTEYAFDFGDGTVVAGDADTATHVYTVAGTYTVQLTVTDRDGAGSTLGTSSMSRQVSAGSGNQLTALLSVSPSTVTVGETVTFDGCHSLAADGQQITSFTFDPDGDGRIAAVTQSVSNPVSCSAGHEDASIYRFTYSAPGAYVPTLTVTDDAGQSKSVHAQVEVVPAAPTDAPAPPESGRRGGGGALGLALLLPLLGLGLLRR